MRQVGKHKFGLQNELKIFYLSLENQELPSAKSIQLINKSSMQFTEIGQLNKLIGNSRNNKYQNKKPRDLDLSENKHKILLAESSGNIESIMRDIDGYAKSLMFKNIQQPVVQEIEETRPKARTQFSIKKQYENEAMEQLTFKKFEKCNRIGGGSNPSSNIFQKKFSKNNTYQVNQGKKIQVFYFGIPISKLIPYDEDTLVENLIEKALFAYLEDNQLDKSKIKTINKEEYTLRFQDIDDICKPDFQAEPLDPNSRVNQLSEQSFILLPKELQSPGLKKLRLKVSQIKKTIKIYDEKGIEINTGSFQNNRLTSDIYDFIENKCQQPKPFYLTESLENPLELAKNIFINQLETQTLYVKRKVFADQPTTMKAPIQIDKDKLDSDGHEDITPLSLTQASTYQQFKVIKINEKGSRKPKILGIDQNKIYYFDSASKSPQKSSNFIEKILGSSMTFGNNNSQIFIKDIVSLTQNEDKNQIYLKLINSSKKYKLQTYEMQKSTRVAIMKKLQFLLDYIKTHAQSKRS